MIVVRVELWSVVDGKKTEIARMAITNTGTGTRSRGNYNGQTFRGRTTGDLDRGIIARTGVVTDYPRLSVHVWNLVARMLTAMDYYK